MTYLSQFKRLVKQLEANPKIKVKKFEVRPKVTAKKLDAIAASKKLSPKMLSLWSEANGLRLSWVASDLRGEIEILPIETVLGSWEETIYFNFTPKADATRHLYPFDFPSDTNADCAALDLGKKGPRVVYHVLGEETLALAADVPAYLALALQCRGLRGWQEALAADRAGKDVPEFRDQMTSLFPDVPLTEVLERAAPKPKQAPKGGTVLERLTLELDTLGAKYRSLTPISIGKIKNVPVLELVSGPVNFGKVQQALVQVVGPYWRDFAKSMARAESLTGGPEGARMKFVRK